MRKFALLLACLLTLSGCAGRSAPAPENERPDNGISFTDSLGQTVSLSPPRRVAALIGSFADQTGTGVWNVRSAWASRAIDPEKVRLETAEIGCFSRSARRTSSSCVNAVSGIFTEADHSQQEAPNSATMNQLGRRVSVNFPARPGPFRQQ